jgi:hypothetical protein
MAKDCLVSCGASSRSYLTALCLIFVESRAKDDFLNRLSNTDARVDGCQMQRVGCKRPAQRGLLRFAISLRAKSTARFCDIGGRSSNQALQARTKRRTKPSVPPLVGKATLAYSKQRLGGL